MKLKIAVREGRCIGRGIGIGGESDGPGNLTLGRKLPRHRKPSSPLSP